MKNIVILTGAGISAESGIQTFRDVNGLWNNHNIVDVASYTGWCKNPNLVNDFYNLRRQNVRSSQPNDAHKILYDLEYDYNVTIVTQNVDDLHERAGSSNVIHLHGDILTAISSDPNSNDKTIYKVGNSGLNEYRELDANGIPLRPNIVWFDEKIQNLQNAIDVIKEADMFIVIGTSFEVSTADILLSHVSDSAKKYNINPDKSCNVNGYENIHRLASDGLYDLLMNGVL